MAIKLNGFEYQCWHELGHAIVCIELGGTVEFIDFPEDPDCKGIARTRCVTTPDIRKAVACGGFAAELFMFRKNLLEERLCEKVMSQEIYKNAYLDRQMFFSKETNFTKEEDLDFANLSYVTCFPIIDKYHVAIQIAVAHLIENHKITGNEISEIMQPFK